MIQCNQITKFVCHVNQNRSVGNYWKQFCRFIINLTTMQLSDRISTKTLIMLSTIWLYLIATRAGWWMHCTLRVTHFPRLRVLKDWETRGKRGAESTKRDRRILSQMRWREKNPSQSAVWKWSRRWQRATLWQKFPTASLFWKNIY